MQSKLQLEGFESETALEDAIKKLEANLKRARKKEVDGEDPEPAVRPLTFSRLASDLMPILRLAGGTDLSTTGHTRRRREPFNTSYNAVTLMSFYLCDQLDEEGLKEKRKQKLLKAGFEARVRARREKEREKGEREAEERRELEERERDLPGWAGKLRREHEVRPTAVDS